MGTYRKPLDLYRAQLKKFEKMQAGARAMHSAMAREGLADAIELTGGTMTKKQTKGRYARRTTARGRLPGLKINIQTARLRRSFKLVGTYSRTGQSYRLVNPMPYSKFVLMRPGTRKMIYRGFQDEVQKRWRARNKALLDTLKARQRRIA